MAEEKHIRPSGSAGCPRAKAEGSFIALATGDAPGWHQELPRKFIGKLESNKPSPKLRAWIRRGGGQYYPHEEPIQRGEYSDATQLALAVARARLVAGDSWWKVLTRTELPLWTLYERGGGGATKRATACWLKGISPVKWFKDIGVKTVCIRPSSPRENGFNESFNGKLQDEFPCCESFYALKEMRVLTGVAHPLQPRPAPQRMGEILGGKSHPPSPASFRHAP